MRLNEKFRNAELKDFKKIAEDFDSADWSGIVETIRVTFEKWPAVAKECAVAEKYTTGIGRKIGENIKRVSKPIVPGHAGLQLTSLPTPPG